MRRIHFVFAIAFILILAACTTTKVVDAPEKTNPGSGNVVEMTIEAYSYGFTMSQATIKKGDKVRIKVTSSSGTHGLEIPEFGVSTGPVAPGQEETIEFVADKSGSFDYNCNIPCGSGHREMRGKLVIE